MLIEMITPKVKEIEEKFGRKTKRGQVFTFAYRA
jgi:hypothetical protein